MGTSCRSACEKLHGFELCLDAKEVDLAVLVYTVRLLKLAKERACSLARTYIHVFDVLCSKARVCSITRTYIHAFDVLCTKARVCSITRTYIHAFDLLCSKARACSLVRGHDIQGDSGGPNVDLSCREGPRASCNFPASTRHVAYQRRNAGWPLEH